MTITITEPTKNTTQKVFSSGDLTALTRKDPVFVTGQLFWCNTQSARTQTNDNGTESSKFKISVKISDPNVRKQLKTIKCEGKQLKTSNVKEDEETGGTFVYVNFSQNEYIKGEHAFRNNGETVPVFDTHRQKFFLDGQEIGNGSFGTIKGTPYPHQNGVSLNLQAIQLVEFLPYVGGAGDASDGFEGEPSDSFPKEAAGMDDVPF